MNRRNTDLETTWKSLSPYFKRETICTSNGLVQAMLWIITCLQRLVETHGWQFEHQNNKSFVAKSEKAQNENLIITCIREMQRGRSGLAPMKTAIAADDDGFPCVTTTTSAQQQQWRHHFTKVLIVISSFDAAELKKY